MGKAHVYMCLPIAPIKSTAGNKTRFFPNPFLISTNSFLILTEGLRNDYIAAFSTALRSATENKELGGNVIVPCPFKMTQRSSTSDWLKF